MNPSPLRVAVLVDTPKVNRYLRGLLDWLATTRDVTVVGVYRPQRGYPPKPDPDDIDAQVLIAAKAALAKRPSGWTGKATAGLFYAVDRWLSDLPSAANPRRGMARIEPQPVPEGGIDCDLLIRAGSNDPAAWAAARFTRYGAIGLDFAIDVDPVKSSAGLDEVARRDHETGFVLYRIVNPGPRVGETGAPGLGRQSRVSPWPANVIRHGWYPTRPSAARNRAQLYGNVLRVLKDAVVQCAAFHREQAEAEAQLAGQPGGALASQLAGRPTNPLAAHADALVDALAGGDDDGLCDGHDDGFGETPYDGLPDSPFHAPRDVPMTASAGLGFDPSGHGSLVPTLPNAPWPQDPQAVHDAGRPVAAMLNPRRHGTPSITRQGYFAYRSLRRGLSAMWPGRGQPQAGLGVLHNGHPVTMSLAGVQPLAMSRRPLRDQACLVAPASAHEPTVLFARERSGPKAAASIVALRLEISPATGPGSGDPATAVPTATARELGPVLTGENWSSPFAFNWEGERYLCASTDRGRIVVHRAQEWPLRWTQAAVLMEGVSAAGTVLFEQDGRWWMLTNLDRSAAQGIGSGDGLPATDDTVSELHAFHADHPLSSTWTAHALNPLRIDSRGARNAALTVDAEGVHRCGQLHRFDAEGSGVAIYRISTLTPDSYREVLVRVVDPEHLTTLPGLTGVQAFLRDGRWAVLSLTHRGALRRSEQPVRVPSRRARTVRDPAR